MCFLIVLSQPSNADFKAFKRDQEMLESRQEIAYMESETKIDWQALQKLPAITFDTIKERIRKTYRILNNFVLSFLNCSNYFYLDSISKIKMSRL
jgi:hypothetical protein